MVLSSLFPQKKSPVKGVPVIPGGTLWGGHLHLMKEPNFEKALYKWSVEHADKNGRVTFYMGPTTPSLSVTHPDDVQLVLKATAHRTLFPLMQVHFQHLFGTHNVGSLNGTEWKQQRVRITKALHAPAVIQHHAQAFEEVTQHFVAALETKLDTNGSYAIDDIQTLMNALTLDCFGQAAFHVDFGTCQSTLNENPNENEAIVANIGAAFDTLTSEMMRRVTQDIMNPASHLYGLPTASNKMHNEEKDKVIHFLEGLIQKRQSDIENGTNIPDDLVTGFMEHFQTAEGREKTDTTLVSVISQSIMALLFAGYETSSVTLTYGLYLLSQHADVLDNVLQEITRANFHDHGQHATFPVPYLEACLRETLRLYPPAISTTRAADRDLELPARNGTPAIHVPKGTYLYVPIWIIQRSADNFPEPEQFHPERWVQRDADGISWKERVDNDNDNNSKAWIPFSAGARACPGQRFAMQEMTTILRILLPRLTLEAPADYQLEPHRNGFIQTPKSGIPMTIRKRSNK